MPIRTLTTQMKSVGEVMAMGRTFQESLAEGAARAGDRQRRPRRGLCRGTSTRRTAHRLEQEICGARRRSPVVCGGRVPARLDLRSDPSIVADRSLVPGADRGPGRRRAGTDRRRRDGAGRGSSADGSSARALPTAASPPCWVCPRIRSGAAGSDSASARCSSVSIPAPRSLPRPPPICTRPTRKSAKQSRPTATRS